MDQLFLQKLTEGIEANIGNPTFGAEDLAKLMGMSHTNLLRRVRSVAGKSINQLIKETRLKKAWELMQTERITVSEVAYKLGFSSPSYFASCFHDFFGYPPGEARKIQVVGTEGDSTLASPEVSGPATESGRDEPGKEPLVDLPFTEKEEERAERKDGGKDKTSIFKHKPFFWVIPLGILALVAAVLVYPKIFKRDAIENLRTSGRISVVVMPFQNLTNDTTWNVWQEGIQENLITELSNNPEELIVRQIETIHDILQSSGTVNYASITPSFASAISKKLDANVFIRGSINQSGSTIRVNAQLIDTKRKNVIRAFPIDGTAGNIIPTLDSLSGMIRNFLIITLLGKELPNDMYSIPTTNSPDAYRYFLLGRKAYLNWDYQTAIGLYLRALAFDSTYYPAIQQISSAYLALHGYKEAKTWCDKLREKEGLMTSYWKIYADYQYALCNGGPEECIKYLRQLLNIDPMQPMLYYQLGYNYSLLEQYNNAIPLKEKALEIYKKLGIKPLWFSYYTALGRAYHKTSQFKKEKKLYKKAEQDFPGNVDLIFMQAILALTEGKIKDADNYIEKFNFIEKDMLWSEAMIKYYLGSIYWSAGMLDKAEGFYRQAVAIEPENPMWLNGVAVCRLENRDLGQAIQFVDRALQLSPDNYEYLDTRGWILYLQGKYQEALEVLQKSWDLRMKNAVYSHEGYLHLEEAKKAVAQNK